MLKIWFPCLAVTLVKCNFENNFVAIQLQRGGYYNMENDRWIWKNQEIDSRTENIEGRLLNPCEIRETYNPQMPNFKARDRRISETKCYEYIWSIKYREDKEALSSSCLSYYLLRSSANSYLRSYIVGGHDTSSGEFPHMAAIGWKAAVGTWIFNCGSTLISSKFVLTAAHCSKISSFDTRVADPTPKIVRLGDKNIEDVFSNHHFPYDVNIKTVTVHPNYAAPNKYNDIALMELAEEVVFSFHVQPACLWTNPKTSDLGRKANITGWGVVETGSIAISPELKVAEINIVDSKKCNELLLPSCNRHWCGVADHQLCAGIKDGGVDACQGDSGGPLQLKINLPNITKVSMHYIIGVTSFGIGCARAHLPGVYTRVSSYVDWIESIVWK